MYLPTFYSNTALKYLLCFEVMIISSLFYLMLTQLHVYHIGNQSNSVVGGTLNESTEWLLHTEKKMYIVQYTLFSADCNNR